MIIGFARRANSVAITLDTWIRPAYVRACVSWNEDHDLCSYQRGCFEIFGPSEVSICGKEGKYWKKRDGSVGEAKVRPAHLAGEKGPEYLGNQPDFILIDDDLVRPPLARRTKAHHFALVVVGYFIARLLDWLTF